MKQQSGFIDPTVALLTVAAVVVIGGLAFGLPQYNVWTKTLNGKVLLREQEIETLQNKITEQQKEIMILQEQIRLLTLVKEYDV